MHTGFWWGNLKEIGLGRLKANSHIPYRSPAVPRICHSESDHSRPRQGNGMVCVNRPVALEERIILRWSLNRIDWIDLAQDREKWWGVVNLLMTLRVCLRQLRDSFSRASLPRGVHLSDRLYPGIKHWRVAVALFAYMPPVKCIMPYS
jgi:hypothetical protein